MLSVTKIFEFAYGHHLPNYEGKCKNRHGHTGIMEIEISGKLSSYEGMVIDFGELKKIVEDKIVSKFDHNYLNDFITRPTAENMTMWVVKILQDPSCFGENLERVRIYETPTSYAEWRK